MPKRKRLLLVLFLCLFCFAVLAGCKGKNAKVEGEALDFTVLSKEDIPEELQKVIEEHKTQEITMSYRQGMPWYIVRGYGQQETAATAFPWKPVCWQMTGFMSCFNFTDRQRMRPL